MLGVSRPKPLIKRICGTVNESLLDDANYSLKKSKALLDIESYKAMGVERYEIVGTKDDRTCPKCQKMNNKVFSLSRAQVEKTFPPFCRNAVAQQFLILMMNNWHKKRDYVSIVL